MKKLFKSEKGFTLIELMVVIAIIAILAVVLVPKMGFMKNTAREAGLDSNMRIVEATVISMLPKYNAGHVWDDDTEGYLNIDLKNKLDDNLTNPFSNKTDAVLYGDSTTQPAVVVYHGAYSDWSGDYDNLAGAVVCCLTTVQGHIKAEIGYVDENGEALDSNKTRVVE